MPGRPLRDETHFEGTPYDDPVLARRRASLRGSGTRLVERVVAPARPGHGPDNDTPFADALADLAG